MVLFTKSLSANAFFRGRAVGGWDRTSENDMIFYFNENNKESHPFPYPPNLLYVKILPA